MAELTLVSYKAGVVVVVVVVVVVAKCGGVSGGIGCATTRCRGQG